MYDFNHTLINIEHIKAKICSENSYSEIYRLVSEMIIPVDYVIQKKNTFLFRARRNFGCEKYNFKEQISYRLDFKNITEFGRANEIGQSIFYASTEEETALFETSSMIKKMDNHGRIERITLGRWRVCEDFKLIAMITNDQAKSINELIMKLYNESLTSNEINDDINQIRRFFSDEFAKTVNNSNLYMTSCAFFNILIDGNNNAYGVLYPSVEYQFQGINIAIIPEAANSFLALDSVEEWEIDMSKNHIHQVEFVDIKSWTIKRIT